MGPTRRAPPTREEPRAERLADTYATIAQELEELDLEAEAALADELIVALDAVDRAYALETTRAPNPLTRR